MIISRVTTLTILLLLFAVLPNQPSSAIVSDNTEIEIITSENVESFLGYWTNDDPNTRGIPHVNIRRDNNTLFVHMWGKCHPTNCDWGEATTTIDDAANGVLELTWTFSFAITTQSLSILPDGRLQVRGHTHFTDDSGRSDYDSVYTFRLARNIAYIYDSDISTATSFYDLLVQNGYTYVTLITLDDIETIDFTEYPLIIIAHDTANRGTWKGTLAQKEHLVEQTTCLLALGPGGSTFYDLLELNIGWNHGAYINTDSIISNHSIIGPIGNPVTLYTQEHLNLGIYMPQPISGVKVFGTLLNKNHKSLVMEDHYLLWGYSGSPELMTDEGRQIFIRFIDAAINTECVTSAPTPTPSVTHTPTSVSTSTPSMRSAPEKPQLLTPQEDVVLRPGPITFSWSTADGATAYGIEISKRNGEKIIYTGRELTSTEYTYTLDAGEYLWQVESYCPNNLCTTTYSGWSEKRALSVQNPPTPTPTPTRRTAPAIPHLLSPHDDAILRPGTISFSWDIADGATTYGIELSKSNGEKIIYTDRELTSTGYTYTLDEGEYRWQVESYCSSELCMTTYSGWSEKRTFFVQAPTPTNTPTPTYTATPTPTLTPTPTATSTSTKISTDTPNPTATSELPTVTPTFVPTSPSGQGDNYESNDSCALANRVSTSGTIQEHTFHAPGDIDWVRFDAIAGNEYRIEIMVPDGSRADVAPEIHTQCRTLPEDEDWTGIFGPGARLMFIAEKDGPAFLRLANNDDGIHGADVTYQLSVRAMSAEPTSRALILVAGKYKRNDKLQRNIHNVTNRVYEVFQRNGYEDDDIYYLATDTTLAGYDAPSTLENIELAITQWAMERLENDGVLNLYMMNHGARDEFFLDKPNGHVLTPSDLDRWLTIIEDAKSNLKVNIFLEACNIGSFIHSKDGSVSKAGRVVITSSDLNFVAYASRDGAYFSDSFLTELQQGRDLSASFTEGLNEVSKRFVLQQPWLDANGNGVHNEAGDYAIAAQRSFAYTGTFSDDRWPPYIDTLSGSIDVKFNSGTIQAKIRDDSSIEYVWAVIYPPSYEPRENRSDELIQESLLTLTLTRTMDDIYESPIITNEYGIHEIIVHAKDSDGLHARPKTLRLFVGHRVYLPTVSR